MKDTLKNLEEKRRSLYRKLEGLGDLRRGTITTNFRKCGKKNCRCANKGHPGHGPQYLWSTTIKGKSRTKKVTLGPEMKKYMEETANYPASLKLFDEILEVNEKICDLRPVPDIKDEKELEELKKKLQSFFKRKYKKRLTAS